MTQKTRNNTIPRWILSIIQLYILLSVPLLLMFGSARLVMNPAFLRFEYTRAGFPMDVYGFSTEDRLEYGPLGIEYILSGAPISFLGDLRLPINLCYLPSPNAEDCEMFNELELRHMHDVQVVAQGVFLAGTILAITTAIFAGLLYLANYRHRLRLALLQGGLLTLGFVVTVILLAVTAWNQFFDLFHSLFFEDGTWRFYYSDTLIRLYPEQFWFDASLLVGTLVTVGALVILAAIWFTWPKNHAETQ